MTIDLSLGLVKTDLYEAFKFPGGELHFKLNMQGFSKKMEEAKSNEITIVAKLNTSDDIILLFLVIDTIKKDFESNYLSVLIPYMAYQQADRDFGMGESFSLRTITKLLNSFGVNKFVVFDAHSDVTPALLNKCKVVDNSAFIEFSISKWAEFTKKEEKDLVILSPDAGAWKKIGKLAEKIEFKGNIAAANKYRNISSGEIASTEISVNDFEGKDVLIIDDICMGGGTFIALAKLLKEKNAGKLYLAISHGIFSNGFRTILDQFDKIFITDSRNPMRPAGEYTNGVYIYKNILQ